MTVTVTPLNPLFGAAITGVDLNALAYTDFAAIRAAFEVHGILVFRGQPLDDDAQIAFSERFGPLENTVKTNPSAGSLFARQSNIDRATGTSMAADDRRLFYQKGNMRWHADSTFKKVPSLCSILTARIVPPEGGATEFASTRALYDDLDAATRERLADAVVEHDFAWSRAQIGFKFSAEQKAESPPVRHPLVQTNPVTGRKSLMIGAHAKCIVGWDEDESRAMLDRLMDRATAPDRIHVHHWRAGDAIVWDNRATLHRATPFDATKHQRLMQRTTVSYPEAVAAYAAYPDITNHTNT